MIKIIGHPFSSIGMGEHPRSVLQSFQAVGINAQLVNIYPEYTGNLLENPYRNFSASLSHRLSRTLNIFTINADEVDLALGRLLSIGDNHERFNSAYNIIYPAWELARFPEEYYRSLRHFDEVWTPSTFVCDAISLANRLKLAIRSMPLAVDIGDIEYYRRSDLQLSGDSFIFSFFYSSSSYSQRKNPRAVIEAFDQLASKYPSKDLRLIIKTNPVGGNRWQCSAELSRLIDATENRHQIDVVIDEWPPSKVYNLLRLSDAFISLHRAEGFGRGMAEAMLLNTPVIATAYSGNMEFCNEDTCFLVDFDLIDVKPNDYPHWESQVWADPLTESAFRQMEVVLTDVTAREAKAAAAKAFVEKHHSFKATGNRYLQRVLEVSGSSI